MSIEAMIEQISERVALRVVEARLPLVQQANHDNEEAEKLRRRIELIKAKENCSVNEAALLLNCSPSHIRNLVNKAKKKKTKRPIPFYDLEGVTVFNPTELQLWKENKPVTSESTEQPRPKVNLRSVK